jgi:hypothetical protein
MKHLPPSPSRHRLAVLAAAFGLAALAAPVAHAFTIDDQSNTTSNGGARYADPDSRFSSDGSPTTIKQGNTTLQFGGQMGSFDQRYNGNQFFDSISRPGAGR